MIINISFGMGAVRSTVWSADGGCEYEGRRHKGFYLVATMVSANDKVVGGTRQPEKGGGSKGAASRKLEGLTGWSGYEAGDSEEPVFPSMAS
jgi:hypothetical protein